MIAPRRHAGHLDAVLEDPEQLARRDDLILFRSNRFGELLKSIEGINKKTLSIRLRELEKNGIIKRKIYIRNPVRAEYIVTKKGRMLSAILEKMPAFSLSFCYDEVFKDKKRRSFKDIIGRRPYSLYPLV